MQAVLVMFRSDGERRSFSISREMTVIGRRQDCDLMIPLGEVSRKHCRIIRDGDTLRLEDLGSSNGTFHNGRRIQETALAAGDTISVGPVSFVIQIDGVPADDEARPHAGGAALAAAADEDELETLDDDELERTPSNELDRAAANGDANGDELETLDSDDDDAPAPIRAGAHKIDDELDVLADSGGVGGGHDLDAEIEELQLDDDAPDAGDDKLEMLDDSTAGEVTLDDDKPKSKRK